MVNFNYSGLNSYLYRLRARERHLRKKCDWMKKNTAVKYLSSCMVDVCPRCGSSDGDYLQLFYFSVVNRFSGRLYNHKVVVNHYGYNREKGCIESLRNCWVYSAPLEPDWMKGYMLPCVEQEVKG